MPDTQQCSKEGRCFHRSLGAPRKSPGTVCFPVHAPSGHITEGVHLKPLQSRYYHSKLKIRLQEEHPAVLHLGRTLRITWKTDGWVDKMWPIHTTGCHSGSAQAANRTPLVWQPDGVAEAVTCRAGLQRSLCMREPGPVGKEWAANQRCLLGRRAGRPWLKRSPTPPPLGTS